jgi:hypothetical protein
MAAIATRSIRKTNAAVRGCFFAGIEDDAAGVVHGPNINPAAAQTPTLCASADISVKVSKQDVHMVIPIAISFHRDHPGNGLSNYPFNKVAPLCRLSFGVSGRH